MLSRDIVIIADVDCVTNEENGDKEMQVTSGSKAIGIFDIASVNNQLIASAKNITYSYAIEVEKIMYDEQKYLYSFKKNKLYEIKGLSHTKNENRILLLVVPNNDSGVIQAIKEWGELS